MIPTNYKTVLALLFSILSVLKLLSNEPPLIVPKPKHLAITTGTFLLTENISVSMNSSEAEFNKLIPLFTGYLKEDFSISLQTLNKNATLVLEKINADSLGTEGYVLDITPTNIFIRASHPSGMFYGLQTFRQLIFQYHQEGTTHIPCLHISDQPRFTWRGSHMDVSRHFMPVSFIYRYLDYLSYHKMNTFHWHLTDDQGWRIEIKAYPELTRIGAWRDSTLTGHYYDRPNRYDKVSHGGYYTQDEIKNIVAYAAERFITLVPEIELPGHAQAAIASYPWLGCMDTVVGLRSTWGISPFIFNVEDTTFAFLETVLGEVMELFPSPIIHIGGDEAIKDQWKASPAAQSKIQSLGLKNEEELQTWFITRIEHFVRSRGKRIMGWDEIAQEGLPSDVNLMVWRHVNFVKKAVAKGNKVVNTLGRYCYFDSYQAFPPSEPLAIGGYLPVELVYAFDPADGLEENSVLGAQANLWTEYIPDSKHFEYMAFPRMAAMAEVTWCQKGNKDLSFFLKRLDTFSRFYQAKNINYFKGKLCYD